MFRPSPAPPLTSALAAVALLLAGCSGDPRDAGAGDPAPTTDVNDPTPTTSPPSSPPDQATSSPNDWTPLTAWEGRSGPIPAGRVGMTAMGRPDAPWAVVSVPEGFGTIGGWVITNDNPDGGGGGVGYWTIDNVYRDPCGRSLPLEGVDVGTTIEELATAFRQQELSRVTQPAPVTIDGYQGLSLEVHAPKGLDIATCPKYRIWEDSEGGERYMQEPGDWDRLHILDVEGEIVVLTVTFARDASQAGLDLATSIVESVDFVPRP